jgi:hypothetical protein
MPSAALFVRRNQFFTFSVSVLVAPYFEVIVTVTV